MKGFILTLAPALFLLFVSPVIAHSGRTDSSGGHNCSSKSIAKGLCTGYHYHNGGTSTYSRVIPPLTTPTPKPTIKPTPVPTPTPTIAPTQIPEVTPTATPVVMGTSTSNPVSELMGLGIVGAGFYYGLKWLGRKAAPTEEV